MSAGSGPETSRPSARNSRDGRRDDLDLLAPHRAAFAGVRVEAGDREARARDAEAARHVGGDDARGRDDQRARQRRAAPRSSAMWMVTGTTASIGDQIIITGCDGAAPVTLRERAEKFGVAGKREAGGVERRLGDRVGDDRARLARLARSRPRARSIRSPRRAKAGSGAPASASARAASGTTGSARAKAPRELVRARPRRSERQEPSRRAKASSARGSASAKNGAGAALARKPGAQHQFRADAGGIAHRQGERRRRAARRWIAQTAVTAAHGRSWARAYCDAERAADFSERAQGELDEDRLIVDRRRGVTPHRRLTGSLVVVE